MNNHINNKVTIERIIEITERKNLRSKQFIHNNKCSIKSISIPQKNNKKNNNNLFLKQQQQSKEGAKVIILFSL